MSNHHRLVRPRLAAALLAAAVAVLGPAALAPTSSFAGGPGCAGAGKAPGQLSAAEMRGPTICLLNRMRAMHGLGSLSSDHSLRKAAQHHSGDMVRRDYFSHDSPGGSTIKTRIGGSGYLAGANSYLYGEIIGGGTSRLGSPKAVVRAWMHSGVHRSEILNGNFQDLGVGIAHGFPGCGHHGATFTVDFGRRG